MSGKKVGSANVWIKLSASGQPLWINTAQVRRLQSDHRKGRCVIVFTSRDAVTTDQTLDEVMEALGYKTPAEPPIETHETARLEDRASFADGQQAQQPSGEE